MYLSRMVRGTLALSVLGVAVMALTGCGGDWDADRYDDGYTYRKTLFVYLNVADQDGLALDGATVWIDGSQQESRTSDSYSELGLPFPPDWRGWRYNWSGGPYRIDLRDWNNNRATIEVLVSKTGYNTQRTTISLGGYDPEEVYMRQTFVMEQRLAPAGAERIIDCPNPPEIISLQ